MEKNYNLQTPLSELNKQQAVLAYIFEGNRYDIGDKIGLIKATLDFALQREDIRDEVLSYLKTVYKKENLLKSELD